MEIVRCIIMWLKNNKSVTWLSSSELIFNRDVFLEVGTQSEIEAAVSLMSLLMPMWYTKTNFANGKYYRAATCLKMWQLVIRNAIHHILWSGKKLDFCPRLNESNEKQASEKTILLDKNIFLSPIREVTRRARRVGAHVLSYSDERFPNFPETPAD